MTLVIKFVQSVGESAVFKVDKGIVDITSKLSAPNITKEEINNLLNNEERNKLLKFINNVRRSYNAVRSLMKINMLDYFIKNIHDANQLNKNVSERTLYEFTLQLVQFHEVLSGIIDPTKSVFNNIVREWIQLIFYTSP